MSQEPDKGGWAQHLAPGETLTWQGRPNTGFALGPGDAIGVLVYGASTVFSLYLIWEFARVDRLFLALGAVFLIVGGYSFLRALLGATLTRRNSWYAITTQRALIATQMPFRGRTLKSYAIDHTTVLDFEEGALANIYFAQKTYRRSRHTYTKKTGFERIENGARVYALLRDLQMRPAENSPP